MGETLNSVVIRVERVSRFYGNFQAVKEVSFEIKKGEVFGLIGPDGAGKSSIIQILAGVLTPNSGRAFINGIDVTKEPERIKAIIGYMPQGLGVNLYDNLTVEENINFFRDLRLIPEDVFKKNKKILLEITRLRPFLNRQVKDLSGGMRQKLALICTLLHLPDIILLDEPTTGVDPLSRQDFWKIIHSLVKERQITVLLTTSYMDEAERCHKIALMHEGRILLEDFPENLPDLENIFIERITGKKPESFVCKSSKNWDSTVIVCKNVSKVFGDFRAVDKVDLEVKKGEILGLLGPNGAGKTTLIKMMCGLLEPSEGKISILEYDVQKERTKVWNMIGYMSQRFSLYKDLTVKENMELYAGLYGVKNFDLEEFFQRLGLKGLEKKLVKDLPFGIRQRVALACALLHKPPILFLDEPTSGVDPVARRNFWKIIYQISREEGTTVIVSTHYMDEAEHCDRLGLMNRGKLIALGTPEEIKKESENISGYLLQIKTPHFHKAYELIFQEFNENSIYGNKIFVRTFEIENAKEKIKNLLEAQNLLPFEIKQVSVSLQEAFVDFIKRTEGLNV
ncbi:ATP-binding cassette domain-containing protein [Thermodesulfobacterium hydrogeniphilum]|uniref:ATP-binding cassette domain-containing protein n=1 Tax=Thermodesulfobacterium hydrogeniphilum TaxID=161156 RepID=UPI0005700A74|nr:ATP-binding cassette domain-containing protein [Thermodesulfobacterium hydrogeniphilum]